MLLVWYQNFRHDLQIIVSCKPAIINNNTSGYTTPNDASISGDLLSGAKYKFSQNELSFKL